MGLISIQVQLSDSAGLCDNLFWWPVAGSVSFAGEASPLAWNGRGLPPVAELLIRVDATCEYSAERVWKWPVCGRSADFFLLKVDYGGWKKETIPPV